MTASLLQGLRAPILQAPTGSIAGPELAEAVSSAGGLGAMGLTWTAPEVAAEAVRRVRNATPNPFLVNFALAFPPLALEAALKAGAPVVSFSWGDPLPFLSLCRRYGAIVGAQASDLPDADYLLSLDPDFLVCQGTEAGGHVQASDSLWNLLPEMRALAGKVPVIAAGGLSTGEDIARAMRLGAAGAMLGTRYVATIESRAHPYYKARLVSAQGTDTELTCCFDGGWPAAHRVLRNSTLNTWKAAGSPPRGSRPGEADVVAYSAAGEPIARYEDIAPREGMSGAVSEMALYAGTGCGAITEIARAGELTLRLSAELFAALSRS
ncbi:MAG TPA: nitronate monooxygenase [Chthonomonadales bacterium]|nr:nitronate monooxygenase [Chthonomonadales bacterium]